MCTTIYRTHFFNIYKKPSSDNQVSDFKSPESVAEPSKLTTNAFEGFAPARPFDESTSPLPITKATPGGVPVTNLGDSFYKYTL